MSERIALVSDHAGFALKEHTKRLLATLQIPFHDFGPDSDARVDYPDFAVAAAEAVAAGNCSRGILVCGSGIGMSIVANNIRGIRAAECLSVETAVLARAHNDANVLTMGQRLLDLSTAESIVRVFLETPFEGGRHQARVDKIHSLTGK